MTAAPGARPSPLGARHCSPGGRLARRPDRRVIRAAVLGVVLAGCAAAAPAQGGQTAAVFLRLPASARALALGGAYPAAGGDESAIFYNPAQLAGGSARSVGLSVQRYVAETTLGALAAAARLGPGVAAVGLQVLDYGREAEIVPDPAAGSQAGIPTGRTISAVDYAVSVGYAVALGAVRVGAVGKLVRQQIAGVSGGTAAVDVGVSAEAWRGATVSAAVQHVGGSVAMAGACAPLPRTLRVGVSLPAVERGRLGVTGVAEIGAYQGGAEPAAGAEVSWGASGGVTVVARAGARHADAADAGSPLTFGGGLRARRFALDYAYQRFEGFGGTHRVGARWWR